jgi:hypothetical protein
MRWNIAARSTPRRSLASCTPWVTLVATPLVTSDAPSVEITVSLSIEPNGAAASLTSCGSIVESISRTAASPYWP